MKFALKDIDRKVHLDFIRDLKKIKKEGIDNEVIEKLIQAKAHELIPSLLQQGHDQRHVLKAVWRKKIKFNQCLMKGNL